jgi:hypothetical protein
VGVDACELFAQVIVGLAIALVIEVRTSASEVINWAKQSGFKVVADDPEIDSNHLHASMLSFTMLVHAGFAGISLALCLGSTAEDKPLSQAMTWVVLVAVAYQIAWVILFPAFAFAFTAFNAAGHPLSRHSKLLKAGVGGFWLFGLTVAIIMVAAAP